MKTPSNHQKLVKNGKNQPKITNFHQILSKSTIFHAQKSNLCKKSPKIHQIEQKICSILAKNREKCHFLTKFTLFWRKFGQKSHNFTYFPSNKRDFSAKSLSLLLLALRPRLFRFATILPIITIFSLLYIVNFQVNNVSATSITLTIPGSLSLDVNPNTNSGYAKSSNGSISVTADSPFGYTLSIKSKDSTNALINGSNKLASITAAVSENDYKTTTSGGVSSGSSNVNTWGYIPSKVNGSANTNVRPGPSTGGETIEKTTAANANAANSYTVALATKVDKTLASGSYKNTFVISAVANSVNYSITYNLNSGSWTGTSPQTGSTPENKVKLSSVTPTRSNYTFKGWCDTAVASNSTTSPSCPSVTYQPATTYPLTNGDNKINLYAIWQSNGPTTMQDFGDYCSKISNDQNLTLIDTRDDNTYEVAKLKDGNCWMTQNLRIGDNKILNKTLTPSDSDVYYDYTLPNSNKIGFSSIVSQDIYVVESDSGNERKSFGGYYNWLAATAGSGLNTQNDEANYSICPKGWRLPTKAEQESLINQYTISTIQQPPVNFTMAGWYQNSTPYSQGEGGSWWSSAGSGDHAYSLHLYPNIGSRYVVSQDSISVGVSIRCLAYSGGKTMQSVHIWGDSIEKGQTVDNVRDERDGKTYSITRLDDDKLWMTQNLRYENGAMHTTPDPDINHYGSYYNWENAKTVCPKGWRLPTKTELDTIVSKYTISSIQQSPINFAMTGWYEGDTLFSQGQGGSWWSSTKANDSRAYSLHLYPSASINTYNVAGDSTSVGISVRCISSPETNTMQNVYRWGNLVQSNQTVSDIRDERDGNTYSVARLYDGKLWMTQNLRYSAGAMYVTPAPDNNHYGAYYNFENSKKVCPENWHLPSKDEYQALTYVYTYSTFQNPPANFILSGIYQNGSGMEGIDEEGVYRTSSQGNPGGFYYFGLFTGSGVNLSNYPPYGVDYFGYNVRCIADNS